MDLGQAINSNNIMATYPPSHILSAILCTPSEVNDANTTGSSSLAPPLCVTATEGIKLWLVAPVNVIESDPIIVPCSGLNERIVMSCVA